MDPDNKHWHTSPRLENDSQMEYERGRADGEIATRLSALEDHKKIMNGHLAAIEVSINEIKLDQRGMANQMAIDLVTREKVAEALIAQNAKNEAANEKKWTPWLRGASIVVVLPIVFTVMYLIVSLTVGDIIGSKQ